MCKKTTELLEVCNQIAKSLDDDKEMPCATDDWKEHIGKIAPLVRKLPKAICECIGNGDIRKVSFCKTTVHAKETKTPEMRDSFSVEYDCSPKWKWSFLIPLALIVSALALAVVVAIRASQPCLGKCKEPNLQQKMISDSHDNTQYVVVQGGDHIAESKIPVSFTMPKSELETNDVAKRGMDSTQNTTKPTNSSENSCPK